MVNFNSIKIELKQRCEGNLKENRRYFLSAIGMMGIPDEAD